MLRLSRARRLAEQAPEALWNHLADRLVRRGVRPLSLLVDTNVCLAYADSSDPDHDRCVAVLDAEPEQLVTTALVVAEAGWLIERQLGGRAEAAFYASIAAGELIFHQLLAADWQRVSELTEAYADNGLGGVDASLVATAERLDMTTIATLDQRHFRVARPSHIDAFSLAP